MNVIRHTGRRTVDIVDLYFILEDKGVEPGVTECCFLARGQESCRAKATHAVIDHRTGKNGPRDVVMPGCDTCVVVFAEADANDRYSVVPFIDLDVCEGDDY